MAMVYRTRLRPPPLPLDAGTSASMARHYAAAIGAAGGRMQAARAAAAGVFARRADEAPDEHARLQRLYAQVYTREEIETLMLDTFDALGLRA
jgi:hypothetical protein